MKATKILVAAMAVVIATGCCSCRKQQKTKEIMKLTGTEWTMTQFEGRAFKSNGNYTLNFGEDGRLNGRGDCNNMSGQYKATAERKLDVTDRMAVTRMFCPNQQMEEKFISMITSVDSFEIDGKLLMLFSDGEMVAAFEPKK